MSADRSVLDLVKRVVLEEAGKLGVSVGRIILFGSRARGDYREDSDYDILVVVKERLDWRLRRELSLRIRRRLYRILEKPLDLVIEDEETFSKRSRLLGSLEEIVAREGVVV